LAAPTSFIPSPRSPQPSSTTWRITPSPSRRGSTNNIAEDIYLAAGATLGIGRRPSKETPSADPLLRSEFGAYPDMYWASFRVYF